MTAIIGVLAQKGGVGKSALARTVATAYAQAGWKVALVDADQEQGTTSQWFQRRLESVPEGGAGMVVVTPHGVNPLAKVIRDHEPDLIVIDGCPRNTSATALFAESADLVLIPSGVSFDDLTPAATLCRSLHHSHGVSLERIRFVLNRAGTKAQEIEEQGAALTDAGGAKVLGITLRERLSYRAALDAGKTLTEVTHPIVKREAQALIDEVAATLEALI
ncbi:MAG: division plane positioning ATPase MipZ [Aeromonas sp.]